MPQAANKTGSRTLFAWADVTSATVSIGTPIDVSTLFEMAIVMRIGRRSGSAFTAGWPNIRVEGSIKSSGNNSWGTIWAYQPPIGGSIASTTLSAGITASDATFGVASATNLAVGDLVFVGDASAANYEVFRIKTISGTTLTPEDVPVNNHANGALVTDQADIATAVLGIGAYQRIRCVVDNCNSGRDISVEVLAGTLDSVG